MSAGARALLHDDALVVTYDAAAEATMERWLPLHAAEPRHPPAGHATIDVAAGHDGRSGKTGDGDAVLHLGGVAAYARADALELRGASPARADVVLDDRRASIRLPAADDLRADDDVYSMLTLASAFLLGRLGGALVHAGGVVDPEGRAWLLVGDTHAGKTTTCVSLVAAGWRYLADDQVVLRRDAAGDVFVEGWPRRAHLDEGWPEGIVTHTRGAVDLRARWGDRWLACAPLGGVVLPVVRADEATRASDVDAATAFGALLRQSPWLMADGGAAPDVLALLTATASRRSRSLSLGRDSYARGDVLAERLRG